MSTDTTESLVEALDLVLETERRALIDGDFDRLESLLEEKEALVGKLNALARVESDDLAGVRKKMNRNQDLMNSALDGIRAVANRMAELRRVRQGLATYDRDGTRHQISTSFARKLEKRA